MWQKTPESIVLILFHLYTARDDGKNNTVAQQNTI
jgi:hypothetical protein